MHKEGASRGGGAATTVRSAGAGEGGDAGIGRGQCDDAARVWGRSNDERASVSVRLEAPGLVLPFQSLLSAPIGPPWRFRRLFMWGLSLCSYHYLSIVYCYFTFMRLIFIKSEILLDTLESVGLIIMFLGYLPSVF